MSEGAPRRIRAVLLDAGGTLIRMREPVGEVYARIAAQHGVRVPACRLGDAFRRVLRGAPPMPASDDDAERAWWRGVVRATFRAADQMVRFDDFEAFFAALFAHYAQADAWRAMPGAHEGLAALRASGRRVAVASNFDQRLHGILAGLGLAASLDLVWLPRDAGTSKPDPAFFTGACARLGVAPAAALAVGDDPEEDVAAARRAGLAAIAVDTLASLGALAQRIDAIERGEAEEAG
ncbi:MAG: haloacid dehalogenase [Proteobacteria bacterium]|nr:MAG: haloacid dehalogenase [Pseudomonadota bacterium]